MSRRILVTGATGKVGTTFINRLLADSAHGDTIIRALCHNRKLPAGPRLEVFSGSIDSRDTLSCSLPSLSSCVNSVIAGTWRISRK